MESPHGARRVGRVGPRLEDADESAGQAGRGKGCERGRACRVLARKARPEKWAEADLTRYGGLGGSAAGQPSCSDPTIQSECHGKVSIHSLTVTNEQRQCFLCCSIHSISSPMPFVCLSRALLGLVSHFRPLPPHTVSPPAPVLPSHPFFPLCFFSPPSIFSLTPPAPPSSLRPPLFDTLITVNTSINHTRPLGCSHLQLASRVPLADNRRALSYISPSPPSVLPQSSSLSSLEPHHNHLLLWLPFFLANCVTDPAKP